MNWWQQLRASLPLCERTCYLFSGAQTPLANSVRDAMIEYLDEWDHIGWRIEETAFRHHETAARNLSTVLGCHADRTVIVENTSAGMSLAAAAVLARARRSRTRRPNVVFDPAIHPASSYPWLNARRLGTDIDIRHPTHARPCDVGQAIADLLDSATIAVVVSHVDYLTGARRDLTALARKERGETALLVDAAQSAGAIPTDDLVKDADFIAMPAYKWLFGAPGVGFLIPGDDWLEQPGTPQAGWAAADNPFNADPFRLNLAPGARSWRTGMPNFSGIAAASAALELVIHAAPDRIFSRIEALVTRALEFARSLGLSSPTPTTASQRAGIVALDAPSPVRHAASLRERGIEVGYATGVLRVDPHAFNSEDEVDQAISEIAQLLRP